LNELFFYSLNYSLIIREKVSPRSIHVKIIKYKKNKTYWLAGGGHQVRRPIPFPNPDRAPTSQIKKLSLKNLFLKLQFK
jgi:hypothetical protein